MANRKGLILLGMFGAFALSGCARVKPEQLDAALAQVREEMRSADTSLEGQVRGVGSRVDDLESRMGALEQELRTLGEEFDATVQRFEAAIRFNTPIYFGFDEDQVRSSDHELLDRFASVVREYYPGAAITVEGFTDPSGSAEYNRALGQRRADAVKSYLEGQGLSGSNLKAVSYGKDSSRLVEAGATGPGSAGWQNRRVVLVIDHNPGASSAGTIS